MHMADALLSPAVGAAMWVVSAGCIGYSCKKVREEADDRKVPLMGVLGAFIFAAQMINFSIPGTGSSGHLGGGMILSILLGPYAAFLVMSSVLVVQSLFFADGGLLALGCNIFNMGVFSCFVAYPLVYRLIAGSGGSRTRLFFGATLAGIVALLFGAFAVVLETAASGIADLPFRTFVFLMLPIHFAIGLVEGIVTAAVVSFIFKARPELAQTVQRRSVGGLKPVVAGISCAAIITASVLSWFASADPDGLEWSMQKTAGTTELSSTGPVHAVMSELQRVTAFLPDYEFPVKKQLAVTGGSTKTAAPVALPVEGRRWPVADAGTSVAGLVGGAVTFAGVLFAGIILLRRKTSNV
jgi:cobalt/nickel transport system permease protein